MTPSQNPIILLGQTRYEHIADCAGQILVPETWPHPGIPRPIIRDCDCRDGYGRMWKKGRMGQRGALLEMLGDVATD